MRVTNKSLVKNFTRNINRNLKNMSKYQEQLSTGKEVSRPSDDPFRVIRAMALHTSIDQNEQFKRNIEDSMGWIDTTDTALGQMTEDLNRIRELVIYGANDSLSDTDRNALNEEVKQLVGDLAQVGNSNYDGRYIFGGQSTTSPPFEVDGTLLKYTGDNGILEREISSNVTMKMNIHGEEIMMGQSNEMGEMLQDIINAMESGDTESLSGDLLEKVDGYLDNTLRLRAEIGSKSNRMQAAKDKNETETFNMTELLSKTEDIDFAEKIMEYSTMENVYRASLSTGAKIIQPTLLDFLR